MSGNSQQESEESGESGSIPFGRDGSISWARKSRLHFEFRIVDEGVEATRKVVAIRYGSPYTVPFIFNGTAPEWQGVQGELGVFIEGTCIAGLTVKLIPPGPQPYKVQLFPPYRGVAATLDRAIPSFQLQQGGDIPESELQALLRRNSGDANSDTSGQQSGRASLGGHVLLWQYWPQQQFLDTVILHADSGSLAHASRRAIRSVTRRDEFRMEAKTFDTGRFAYSVQSEIRFDAALRKVLRYDITLAPLMTGICHTVFDAGEAE
jgi:hypothetical protein